MSTPAPRQGRPDAITSIRCHYAADPARRPHCTLTAEILLGAIPLCGSCALARSTLGKGGLRALPASQALDVLGWITDADAATRQAHRTLAAAVTRARSRDTPGPRSPASSASPARPHTSASAEIHCPRLDTGLLTP